MSLAGLEQRARPASERAESGPGSRRGPSPEAGPAATAALPLQLLRTVARSDDPLEREAEELADRVTGGAAPRPPQPGPVPEGSPGEGQPVPGAVRSRIEPHLGTSLGQVRVHGGPAAGEAAARLQARAFTHRNQVFLGPGESRGDLRVMAHEAAHVVQQGGAGAPEVQALPAAITEGLAYYARYVPGYTLLVTIAGYDPLADKPVEPSPANLVAGLFGLVPGGTLIADKLGELGLLEAAADLVRGELARFDLTADRIERALEQAWDEMSFARMDPFDYNVGVLTRVFGALLDDLAGFAASLADQVMARIKEAALGLAEGLLASEPAWGLLKKVIHWDPLRGQPVEATTVEILEDFLRLIGRDQELEQMRARGTLQETAGWLDTQLGTFLSLVGELGALFSAAWAAIQPANLPNLTADLAALAVRAVGFLQRVQEFAVTVAAKVLQLIKQALLGWLSSFAHEVPGFHLLTVIIGRNPFTQEPVPRTAENLIKGFITLLPDGEAQYQQLAETGTIGQAATRIEGAMAQLGISWELVRGTFVGVWEGLSIDDLIDPVAAFVRIRDQFGEPISRLFAFVRVVLEELLTLVLQLMRFPSELVARIISNALQAFEDIKRDPVGFLLNMLAAVKAGFSSFFDNILGHLMRGLVEWLFRGLRQAGIEPPREITLESVLGLVMKVLGITVELLWKKLAARIGQDKVDRIRGAIDKLTGIWTFVRDVQERGAGAVWDYVKTQLGNLWELVLQRARAWIMEKIVDRVTAKLLSMLDPTGIMAVVNGFIAFFNAVQSAIEYLREILEIIDSYVQTFAAVARGDIEPGAARLEQGLASSVPVAIGFLANQVGLGNIGDKVAEILASVRALVDKALDWLMDQAVRLGTALLRGLGFREEDETGKHGDVRDLAEARLRQLLQGHQSVDQIRTVLSDVLSEFQDQGLRRLELGDQAADGSYPVIAEASPAEELMTLTRTAEGWEPGGEPLRRLIAEVAAELLADPQVVERAVQMEEAASRGEPVAVLGGPDYLAAARASQVDFERRATRRYVVGSERLPVNVRPGRIGAESKELFSREEKRAAEGLSEVSAGEVGDLMRLLPHRVVAGGGKYETTVPKRVAAIEGRLGASGGSSESALVDFMQAGEQLDLPKAQRAQLARMSVLLFTTETSRDPSHLADIAMAVDLVGRPRGPRLSATIGGSPDEPLRMEELFRGEGGGPGVLPMTMKGAQPASFLLQVSDVEADVEALGAESPQVPGAGRPAPGPSATSPESRLANARIALAETWLEAQMAESPQLFNDREQAKSYIRTRLRAFFGLTGPGGGTTTS